jgi:hypothetical protein
MIFFFFLDYATQCTQCSVGVLGTIDSGEMQLIFDAIEVRRFHAKFSGRKFGGEDQQLPDLGTIFCKTARWIKRFRVTGHARVAYVLNWDELPILGTPPRPAKRTLCEMVPILYVTP